MMLPEELLWAAGGHASDIVLTALADGEDAIVPPDVRAHVEQCTACTAHLGNAALLALYTQGELAARHEHDLVLADLRRPLPKKSIALGLLAAILGVVPSLLQAEPAALLARARVVLGGVGNYARHAGNPGGLAGLLLPYFVAAMLVGLGFAIVRILPTKDHAS